MGVEQLAFHAGRAGEGVGTAVDGVAGDRQPAAEAWTRIWWVRPVRSFSSSNEPPGQEPTTFQSVREGRPRVRTAIF